MSTVRTWEIESTSSEQTLDIAGQLGSRLRGGEVIALASDLGGGKTTFVRGLAKGLGSRDSVHSPSFTLSNQYRAGRLTLYHFDFYRLSEPGIMRDELAEVLADPTAVVVIEWADIVADVLPPQHATIQLLATGETSRMLRASYPVSYSYLFPDNT